MPKLLVDKSKCSVVGCINPHTSLHRPAASEPLRTKWLDFIFHGNVPSSVGKILFVCAKHFKEECFSNLRQYQKGFAERLRLNEGSVPSIYGNDGHIKTLCTSGKRVRSVACQTDSQKKSTVATQLSLKTLAPTLRSRGTQQTAVSIASVASTKAPVPPSTRPFKRPRMELEDDCEDPLDRASSMESTEVPHDSTCSPADDITTLTESHDDMTEASSSIHKMRSYIVYESCLLELFQKCPVCTGVSGVRTRRLGTLISVEQTCSHCQFFRKWNSQPLIGCTPAGNLQLSSAVYVTGSSFFKLEKVFKAMHLSLHSYDAFQKHARMYIEPAIVYTWRSEQSEMLERLRQQQQVVVGGDMRAGSPVHSATFGCYTMMDLRSGKVIDLQLVQRNEVGSRSLMEREGLKRSLSFLEEQAVTLDSIVTHHHPRIQEYLRDVNIPQYHHVSHMEKGISKKLLKISQKKGCEKLKKWLHSIKNHIYWTAASSSSGPERVAKWTSVLNHIQDIHTHDNPAFPRCLHPQHTTRDRSKWLRAGSPALCKLEAVMMDERILKAVEKLSPHPQTSSLEAFHTTVPHFAPKHALFPFLGLLCRLYLAALHFNENSGRPQAAAASGELLYRLSVTHSKSGHCSAKPVRVDPTFNYVGKLMDVIFEEVCCDPTPYVKDLLSIPVPDDLTSQFAKPDKLEVISGYVSRFNHGRV